MTKSRTELLQHALLGFEARRQEIDRQIKELRQRLDGPPEAPQPKPGRRRRRHLSPEGRANIIAATKRRWAKVRREKRAGRG